MNSANNRVTALDYALRFRAFDPTVDPIACAETFLPFLTADGEITPAREHWLARAMGSRQTPADTVELAERYLAYVRGGNVSGAIP